MKYGIMLVPMFFISGCIAVSSKTCKPFSDAALERGRGQGYAQGMVDGREDAKDSYAPILSNLAGRLNSCNRGLADCQSDLKNKTEILENQK